MGILRAIATDIEELVQEGYDDKYISISVGEDLNTIEYIIKYFRDQQEKHNPPKINTKVNK